jgi:hypothetical protein
MLHNEPSQPTATHHHAPEPAAVACVDQPASYAMKLGLVEQLRSSGTQRTMVGTE